MAKPEFGLTTAANRNAHDLCAAVQLFNQALTKGLTRGISLRQVAPVQQGSGSSCLTDCCFSQL